MSNLPNLTQNLANFSTNSSKENFKENFIIFRNAVVKTMIESTPRTKESFIPTTPSTPPTPSVKSKKPEPKNSSLLRPALKQTTNRNPSKHIHFSKPEENSISNQSVGMIDGVHLDVYRYFDISPSLAQKNDIDRLKTINEWAFLKSKTVKEALRRLFNIENKIGMRYVGGEKLSRLYNYVRLYGNT